MYFDGDGPSAIYTIVFELIKIQSTQTAADLLVEARVRGIANVT